MKYYSLKNILKRGATYNVIFGERSNGKTFSVHDYALERYAKKGDQLAIIRRNREDFTGKRGASTFEGVVNAGRVSKWTGGEWTGIYYRSNRWYFMRYNEKGERVVNDDPFAFAFALSSMEHDKSTEYPRVTTVLYDEFIARTFELVNEFELFTNTLSTIIRQRSNVTIFMLGNTVNRYSTYFTEMGLKHVKQMKPGDIDVYTYGDSKLTVAVEYTAPNVNGKPSDFYFAFDNPRMKMITEGGWEIASYPHCPIKYKPKDVVFTFFIIFDSDILQCEVIYLPNTRFIFIHRKTSELQTPDRDLIFSTDYDPRRNWRRFINKPTDEVTQKIALFFREEKVYYQDNEVGEIVRNYLMWCIKNK